LKRRTPKGVWALRGVTVAVALVALLVVGSVAYSAYEDYSALRSGLASGNRPIAGTALYDQATGAETVSINVTVSNRGLYPLNVTISCSSSSPDVQCQTGGGVVPPGQQQVVRFEMTVSDVQQFLASGNHQVNGTVDLALEPFAELSVGVNFTGLIQVPGGP
jgi:hypothetical protein